MRLGFDDDVYAEQNWLLDTVNINSLSTVSELTIMVIVFQHVN